MAEQVKLPKEAQEIIKYYSGLDTPLSQCVATLYDMVTELSPYLEDELLPPGLRGESFGLSPSENRQRLLSIAQMLSIERKESPRPQIPSL